MVVYKLVLSIYRLVYEIERRFQRKTLYLRCMVTQGKNVDMQDPKNVRVATEIVLSNWHRCEDTLVYV